MTLSVTLHLPGWVYHVTKHRPQTNKPARMRNRDRETRMKWDDRSTLFPDGSRLKAPVRSQHHDVCRAHACRETTGMTTDHYTKSPDKMAKIVKKRVINVQKNHENKLKNCIVFSFCFFNSLLFFFLFFSSIVFLFVIIVLVCFFTFLIFFNLWLWFFSSSFFLFKFSFLKVFVHFSKSHRNTSFWVVLLFFLLLLGVAAWSPPSLALFSSPFT